VVAGIGEDVITDEPVLGAANRVDDPNCGVEIIGFEKLVVGAEMVGAAKRVADPSAGATLRDPDCA